MDGADCQAPFIFQFRRCTFCSHADCYRHKTIE
jgi:hypothetical protein